jgi:hypothetical protein
MKLPQLHLRDLFWLVLVCAVASGWWADKRTAQQTITRLRDEAVQAEWEIARLKALPVLPHYSMGPGPDYLIGLPPGAKPY